MGATTTVVFVDLTGSTSVFESLGNQRATELVTQLTEWIGAVCRTHHGRVVKTLGDGVLAVFPNGPWALAAAVEMQRAHARRIEDWPNPLRMRLQIGAAAGELVEVQGDCYGDAVNVASRLSDMSGADQIWATDTVVRQSERPPEDVRFRSLGKVQIRGKADRQTLYRIEWHEDVQTQHLTEPGHLMHPPAKVSGEAAITLSWLDQRTRFEAIDMPVHIGRDGEAQFAVADQRVSRLHARIDWRNGNFAVTDLSSYGTWLRFPGSPAELALRRESCALLERGEMALGASFEDFTVPVVAFEVHGRAPS